MQDFYNELMSIRASTYQQCDTALMFACGHFAMNSENSVYIPNEILHTAGRTLSIMRTYRFDDERAVSDAFVRELQRVVTASMRSDITTHDARDLVFNMNAVLV